MYFYYTKRNPHILYLGVLTIDSSKKSHTTEQMFYCEKRKRQTIRKSARIGTVPIRALAYGYRNFKRFRNRILHMFSYQKNKNKNNEKEVA